MQEPSWDSLKYLLAVARHASYPAAAEALGVNETTVMRRLRKLEATLGSRLVDGRKGARGLTEAGQKLVEHLRSAEREIEEALSLTSGHDGQVAGTVTVTAVPVLVNRVFPRTLPALINANPGLAVDLVADGRDLSLDRRETDIALRMARPREEPGMLTRRIATLPYGVFIARGRRVQDLPWLTYPETMGHLPQNRWIADNKQPGDAISPVRLNDAEGLIACAARGLGRALLPEIAGRAVPELQSAGLPCDLTRDVWVILDPNQRRLARIETVMDWLTRTLAP